MGGEKNNSKKIPAVANSQSRRGAEGWLPAAALHPRTPGVFWGPPSSRCLRRPRGREVPAVPCRRGSPRCPQPCRKPRSALAAALCLCERGGRGAGTGCGRRCRERLIPLAFKAGLSGPEQLAAESSACASLRGRGFLPPLIYN